MSGEAPRDLSGLRMDRSARSGKPPRLDSGRKTWMWIFAVIAIPVVLAVFFYNMPFFGDADPIVQTYRVSYASSGASSSLLTASGYVVAQRQAAVSSKATGRLVYLGVEEGDRVKRGDVLARVESEDVQAELSRARANLDVAVGVQQTADARRKEARLQFARIQDLLNRELTSRAEFDAAEAARDVAEAEYVQAGAGIEAARAAVRAAEVAVENTRIRAPFDGTVLTKQADVGEMVAPFGSAQSARGAVVTLADMESLEVEADVSESNIQRVAVGHPTQIVLDAYPGHRYPGRVKKIVPTADRAKATVLTKVEFTEIDERVLPEMSAKVTFLEADAATGVADAELAVPSDAVRRTAEGAFVFTVSDDLVRQRAVQLGPARGNMLVVTEGLREGDRVVTRSSRDLKDGDRVRME